MQTLKCNLQNLFFRMKLGSFKMLHEKIRVNGKNFRINISLLVRADPVEIPILTDSMPQ